MNKYMFEGIELKGNEWTQLQEACYDHGALICTPVKEENQENLPIYKLTDPTTQNYCFVFTDEVDQFSQPYPTCENAQRAMKTYCGNL